MNKSLGTNVIAFLIVAVGYILDNSMVLTIGLFALSGALTNWLAVHMLFEKVPFLYGSGVVENRFEQFKISIHSLIMNQFFTKENLDKFFETEMSSNKKLDLSNVIEKTDSSIAFESLKTAVMESSFGDMLGMFGGVAALEPLKESFEIKMKASITTIVHTDDFQALIQETLQSSDISEDMSKKIDTVVLARLDELNPKMVKDLVQEMIKEHLGWLVVWGGVFGGLIGLVGSFLL
ncbi:MAG: uncharacterized membrane protein YheB (UPF0754 family) [Arcobacteraceae bacterium]|jgi:uncharacterized membrane protein YheB (UPF0754 family)